MNGETPVYEFITFNKSAVSLNQCGSATQSNKVVTGSSHDETRQATNSYPAQAATVRAQRRTIDSIFSCTTSIGERAEIDRPRWSAGARGHRPMNKPSSNTRPMTRLSPWCAPCVGSAPRVPTVEIAVGGDRGALPPAIPRGETRVQKKPQAVQVGLDPCAGRRETNGQAHARKRSKYSSILRTDEKERLDGVEFTPSISVVVSRRRGQKERDDGRACPDDGTREAGVLLPREHLLQQDEHAAKHVSRDAAVGREMAGDRGSSGGGAPGVGEEQRSRSIIASHKSSLNLSRASPDLWCRAAESDCACAPLALDLKPPHACLSHACRSHADGRKLPENYGGWRVALGPPKPMGWPKSGALPPLTTATTSSTTALTVATAATKIKLPQESVHAGRETEASADRPQATLGIAGAQEMGGMQTETVAAEADEKGAGHEAVTQEGGREEGDESGDEGILDLLQLPSSSPFRDDGDLDAAAKDVGSNDWVSETRGLAEVALPCFEAADTSSPASAMWVGPPSLRLETIETCLSPALSVIDSSFGGWGRDDLGMWERTANFGEWWRVDADSDQVGVSGGEPVTSVLAGPKTKVPQSRLNDKKYNSLGLDMTKIGASKAEAASMQRTKDKEASSRTLQASSIDASACTLAPSFSPISRKTSMGTKQVCKGGHGGPRGRGQARIPWRKESASDGERVDGYVESTSSSSLGGIYIGPELCLARERRDKLLQRPFLKKNAMVEPERTSTVVTGTCHPGGGEGDERTLPELRSASHQGLKRSVSVKAGNGCRSQSVPLISRADGAEAAAAGSGEERRKQLAGRESVAWGAIGAKDDWKQSRMSTVEQKMLRKQLDQLRDAVSAQDHDLSGGDLAASAHSKPWPSAALTGAEERSQLDTTGVSPPQCTARPYSPGAFAPRVNTPPEMRPSSPNTRHARQMKQESARVRDSFAERERVRAEAREAERLRLLALSTVMESRALISTTGHQHAPPQFPTPIDSSLKSLLGQDVAGDGLVSHKSARNALDARQNSEQVQGAAIQYDRSFPQKSGKRREGVGSRRVRGLHGVKPPMKRVSVRTPPTGSGGGASGEDAGKRKRGMGEVDTQTNERKKVLEFRVPTAEGDARQGPTWTETPGTMEEEDMSGGWTGSPVLPRFHSLNISS